MIVKKWQAWVAGIAIVGIVIGWGKAADAFSMQGHHLWNVVAIACTAVAAGSLAWLAAKSGGK